mmetsp:Transcript_32338/g.48774  ORF Transcript_32338/g.48774 Transcript_32338/m.48774 type:complete len:368 (-) Transcript_32338:154-1257(-)
MRKQQKHIQKFLQEYAPSKEIVGKASGEGEIGKCLLVVSSTSGFGNASKLAPKVIEYLRPSFSTMKIIPTQHAGHAYEIMNNEPTLSSYQLVVILGGDGAFSEAVNGMLLREDKQIATLAHCPGGSGCATSGNAMGVWKGDDIEKACRIISEGKLQKMDVIEVTRDGFDDPLYSILNVAGGLYTDVVDLADRHYKWTYNIFGPTARYAFGMIRALWKYGKRDNDRMIRYTFNDNESETVVLPTLGYSLYNDGRPMEHARYASCRFHDGTMSLSLSQKYLGLVKHLKYAGDLAKQKDLQDDVKGNHFIRDDIVSMKVEPVEVAHKNGVLPARPLKTMLDGEKDRVTLDYMDAPFTARILPGKISIIVA